MGQMEISDISGLFARLMEIVKAILAALSEGEASSIVGIVSGFFKPASDDE